MFKIKTETKCAPEGITKHQLMSALFAKGGARLTIGDVDFANIVSVEREDGSGNCFNVKGHVIDNAGWIGVVTVFVRTID